MKRKFFSSPKINKIYRKPVVLFGILFVAILGILFSNIFALRLDINQTSPSQLTNRLGTQPNQIIWEEYNNDRYHISIKHPPNINVIEYGEPDYIAYLYITGPTQKQGQEFHDGLVITISAINNNGTTSFETFFEQELMERQTSGTPITIEKGEIINLNGYDAIKFSGQEMSSSYLDIIIPHQGQYLSIKASYGGENEQEYFDTFNEILSTLNLE